MATYVMSDIHGEGERFFAMLKEIEFKDEDQLYIIGDVIDRGEDGIDLLEYIMEKENIILLLGNHEYMCRQFYAIDASQTDMIRWNRNGNEPTLRALKKRSPEQRNKLLKFIRDLPEQIELEIKDHHYLLVHAYPGKNTHDRVWLRPTLLTSFDLKGIDKVILGHTPVVSLLVTSSYEDKIACSQRLDQQGDHFKIIHTRSFIDLDCGCGHFAYHARRLACLRLDDFKEYYR